MPRIELESLLSNQALTLEQDILLNWFYSQFDYRTTAGINRHIANVEPLYFQAAVAGSEFLTYAATKLYICLKLIAGSTGILNASNCSVTGYNEADVVNFRFNQNSVEFDTVVPAARYSAGSIVIQNIFFSRVVFTTYDYIVFNGYRVTLN
jgi:hypothetical protein